MAGNTPARDPLWTKPVPKSFNCLDETQLPPRDHRLSDQWKAAVGGITCKERNSRWPQSFETHGRVNAGDGGLGEAVKITRNGQDFYAIMYGNCQMFGDEGRYAGLQRFTSDKPSGVAMSSKIGDPVVLKPGTRSLKRNTEDNTNGGEKRSKTNEEWNSAVSKLQASVQPLLFSPAGDDGQASEESEESTNIQAAVAANTQASVVPKSKPVRAAVPRKQASVPKLSESTKDAINSIKPEPSTSGLASTPEGEAARQLITLASDSETDSNDGGTSAAALLEHADNMVRDLGALVRTLGREILNTKLDDRALRKVNKMFKGFKDRYGMDLKPVRDANGVTHDSAEMTKFLEPDVARFKKLEEGFLQKLEEEELLQKGKEE